MHFCIVLAQRPIHPARCRQGPAALYEGLQQVKGDSTTDNTALVLWEDTFARTTGSAMIIPPPCCFFKIVAYRPEDFHMFDPGWTTITHLDVLFVGDVLVFFMVMALCPNLQVLEMTGSLCSDVTTSLLAPLFYPLLCELFIAVDVPLTCTNIV
jgi:hypothetical protein